MKTEDHRDRKSTAWSRFLGAELRRRRVAAGLPQQTIAHHLGWATATISRIETGERGITPTNVATYLALCDVGAEDRTALLALADGHDEPWWVCPHENAGPDELNPLLFTHDTASRVRVYHPGSIPDVLQSGEFSSWQIRASLGPDARDEDVDTLLRAQQRRQQVVYRQTPSEWVFYLHASHLLETSCPPEVHHDQLMHLALLITQHRVRIRLLPVGVDSQIRTVGGRFWLFSFADHPPVVCVQGETISVFGERFADVATYERLRHRLDVLALTAQESADLILQLANTAPILALDR